MPQPRTKIVMTIGPASAKPDILPKLLDAGVSVIRLNFSHGTPEQRKAYIDLIRACTANRHIAIMGDLGGPKIRIGHIENGALLVRAGDTITIQREECLGRDNIISTNYPCLVDDLQVGQRILIDDGAIRMIVLEKLADAVLCQVLQGDVLQSNKGLNLPSTQVSIPSITEKDWADIDFAIAEKLDYLALSFVRTATEIQQVRRYLDEHKIRIDLIAKIEKPEAVANLHSIVEAADAVLVARGDLGVEMDLTAVPVMQKEIVNAAHEAGKPVIVATQMLQSMIEAAIPTRAEVSDVANAILDGADACMLSGETAVGKYPVGAALVLHEIAEHTEEYIVKKRLSLTPPKLIQMTHHRTAAIAHGTRCVVEDIDAKLVVVWSQAGGSARYLSKNRLGVPIVALSDDPAAARRMALLYGVTPLHAAIPAHFDDLPLLVDRIANTYGFAQPGDRVVIVAGAPIGLVGVTNSLSVHTISAR